MVHSIEFLKNPRKARISDDLFKQIAYSMKLSKFLDREDLVVEGEELKGIYLIRSGSLNIRVRANLYE